jgi:hypothetical protein
MRVFCALLVLIAATSIGSAEDNTPSRIDSITKSARDMMPAMPSLPSVSLPSKARLRLKSNGASDIQKVNAIAAKSATSGVLISALITSAATAKRIQSTMKLGAAYLDVDFAVPPRVSMKFVGAKAMKKTNPQGTWTNWKSPANS